MMKGLWQRKGIPGPGSGGLKDVCKLKWSSTKQSVFNSITMHVQRKKMEFLYHLLSQCMMEIHLSQAMLYSVLVYPDACTCMELYREKYMAYLCCILPVRQLLFQYQLLSYAGGRCGMEQQSSCLDWKFSLGLPPERSRWVSLLMMAVYSSTLALLNILISIFSAAGFSFHFFSLPCLRYQALLAVLNTD